MERFTNYYRAKGSYSKAGFEAKKAAKGDKSEDREVGTDSVVQHFASMTPGQDSSCTDEKAPYPQTESVDEALVTDMDSMIAAKLAKLKKAGRINQSEWMTLNKMRTSNPKGAMSRIDMMMKQMKEDVDLDEASHVVHITSTDKSGKKEMRTGHVVAQSKQSAINIAKKHYQDQGHTIHAVHYGTKRTPVKEEIEEKTLTPAEMKKREEIAQAIEKDQPDMPMDKKMAIATAQAKKVAEAMTPDQKAKRLSMIRKAHTKVQKRDAAAQKRAERDAKRGISKDRDYMDESVNELQEAMSHAEKVKFQKVGIELKKYGATSGGIDKRTFQDIGHMFDFRTRTADGDEPSNQQILNAILQQDTDVRDKIMDIVTNTFGTKWRSTRPSTKEIFGKFGESVETDKNKPPFDGPYKKRPATTTDKSGAKHTPLSRARHLARQAMLRREELEAHGPVELKSFKDMLEN